MAGKVQSFFLQLQFLCSILVLYYYCRIDALINFVAISCMQIDAISLVYYRKEDNELKYLDLDASIEELIADSELIADK